MPDENPNNVDLSAISVTARIPEFWKDSPRLWFIQAEAVLLPQRMGDDSKYQMVISKLPKETIGQITELLLAPPATGKYDQLKTTLLGIYDESENRKIQKLISEMDLGDQKPSQLLRRMRDLARDKITDKTLSVLWQNHLPTQVRSVLAVASTEELDALAKIADKILESTKPVHEVASVGTAACSSNEASTIIAEISKLGQRLARLEGRNSRSRTRSRGHSNARSKSRQGGRDKKRRAPDDPEWQCYYHFYYKDKARKCVQPCNYEKAKN